MSVATTRKIVKSEYNSSTPNDSLLWPEWSDVALNNENWAIPKNGSDGLFLDTQLVKLPPSLEPHEWLRAKDLKNLSKPLTVFSPNLEYPNLIANNKHILHSEASVHERILIVQVATSSIKSQRENEQFSIARGTVQSLRIKSIKKNGSRAIERGSIRNNFQFAQWFISALINLQYYGRVGLDISNENSNFIWNGRQQSWRGWMNVYSMNKAGRGVQHRPSINPNGKYIVRLYLFGFWRRIVVDDMIPVNAEGLPLLPRTTNDSELWPMLLAKGLLKVCSLTWSEQREIVDFHPVTCLTGWVSLQLNIKYLSPQDKWDFLRQYVDHFEWKEEGTERESYGTSKSTTNTEERRSKGKKSKGTPRRKRSKSIEVSKKIPDSIQILKRLVQPQPVTLFLGLEDTRKMCSKIVPDSPACWSDLIYVAQSRDVPLDPKDVKPPLARWKLFRWLKWAIDEGLIDPVEYFVPIRSLKIVSPLNKYEESVINMYSDPVSRENLQNEDPNHETLDSINRKNKLLDVSKEPQEKLSTEDFQEDISFWADFNKMEPFVKDIHFFYKPECFRYTVKLSDSLGTKQLSDQRSETRRSSRKGNRSSPNRITFKEPEFVNAYCWPQKMSKTRNEPLYIFVDSLQEKFFLINFATFQVSTKTRDDNASNDSTNVPVASKDYLTVEKHSWFHRAKRNNCLVHVSTAGSKSTVMELKPGRLLLRVYCRSESHCFVTIFSDTIFHVGDRRKMYQLMSTESERIDQMAKHISNSVANAYQSFGTETYLKALRTYYDSYTPSIENVNKKSKVFHNYIHEYFIDEKVQLIRKIFPAAQVPDILRSLRIFFLNYTIGLECFSSMKMMLKSLREFNTPKRSSRESRRSTDESLDRSALRKDSAAAIVQSFFKALTIRKYKAIHDPGHKQHQEVLDNLLKVAELFNYNKRETLANQLLRKVLKFCDKLYGVYPCFGDLEYTLQVQELRGTLTNVKPNQWLPIARFVANPRFTEMVTAGIDLFVELPRYSVRAIDNTSNKEIFRLVNNVIPFRYEHTKVGYTISAYGWSEDQGFKDLPWTMNIITMKGQPSFHLLDDETPISSTTMLPVLNIEELFNNYLPNKNNYISKCIVRVTKPSVVSFRLRTSYDQVKIKFRIVDSEGHVLSQVKGTSTVILPAVYLGLRPEASQTIIAIGEDTSCLDDVSNANEDSFLNGNANESEEEMINDVSESIEESVNHQTYLVEAFVVEDSWPLTKSEWAAVMEVKTKLTGSILKIKPSISNASRSSRTELPKIRKGSKQPVDNNRALEPPYWVLQVVTDSDGGLEISEDRTKAKQIARMKEAWAKENPDSLERGRKLREAFLKKHELRPESSRTEVKRKSSIVSRRSSAKKDSARSSLDYLETSVPSLEPRTSEPTESLRRLPRLDLSIYTVKEEEEEKVWMKTEKDEEMLRNSRGMNVIYAKEDYGHMLEDMQVLLNKQKERYRLLFSGHYDAFWERRAELEDVYEARKLYITSLRPASVPSSKKRSVKSKKV